MAVLMGGLYGVWQSANQLVRKKLLKKLALRGVFGVYYGFGWRSEYDSLSG